MLNLSALICWLASLFITKRIPEWRGADGIKYDSAFDKYICSKNVFLNNRRFAFMAEINVLPTADYPLSGFAETATALNLEGLAIERLNHRRKRASFKGEVVRRMYSTGTATLKTTSSRRQDKKRKRCIISVRLLSSLTKTVSFCAPA